MQVAFYKSSGIAARLIREWTWAWAKGQPFFEVPAHVAVRIGDRVYEAVVRGVQARAWGSHPEDLTCRLIDVAAVWPYAIHPEAAEAWATARLGKPYDWLALLCGWPDLTGERFDCYRLAVGAMQAAGVPIPFAGVSESPNFLLRWMQAQVKYPRLKAGASTGLTDAVLPHSGCEIENIDGGVGVPVETATDFRRRINDTRPPRNPANQSGLPASTCLHRHLHRRGIGPTEG